MYAQSLKQKHISLVTPRISYDPTFTGRTTSKTLTAAAAPIPEEDRSKLDLTSFPFMVELGENVELTKDLRVQEELVRMEEVREEIAEFKASIKR